MRLFSTREFMRRIWHRATRIALATCAITVSSLALAQTSSEPDDLDTPEALAKVDSLIANVRLPEARLVICLLYTSPSPRD